MNASLFLIMLLVSVDLSMNRQLQCEDELLLCSQILKLWSL